MAFAKGTKALGMCDRCGQRYKLHELRKERHTKMKTCPTCWDPVPQQSWPPFTSTSDPIALRDPRPDPDSGVQTLYDNDDDDLTLLKDVITMTHGDT